MGYTVGGAAVFPVGRSCMRPRPALEGVGGREGCGSTARPRRPLWTWLAAERAGATKAASRAVFPVRRIERLERDKAKLIEGCTSGK